MTDKLNNLLFLAIILISLWTTYMFGYNSGVDDTISKQEISQNKALNALQVANQYQEKYLKCVEEYSK